jgi:PEP-CTERM motif-containing protein
MKRIFTTAAFVLASLATAANAAVSINLTPGSTTATPGSTITLTTFATSDGGETDDTIFGAINYSDAALNSNAGGNSQVTLFNTQGALTCTTAFCVAFSQVNSTGVIALGITNSAIATTTFIVDPATAVGTVVTFNWRTTPSTQRLDWFGLTNAAGTSVTIVAVPEPTTAAMFGLGLLGLAFAGRRRA